MRYFAKEENIANTKNTLSELDRVFFHFSENNNTEDRFDIHDSIISSIKHVFGKIDSNNAWMIQAIIDKVLGEPSVPSGSVDSDVNINKDELKDTTEKFKRLKL